MKDFTCAITGKLCGGGLCQTGRGNYKAPCNTCEIRDEWVKNGNPISDNYDVRRYGEVVAGYTNRVFLEEGWSLVGAVKDNKFDDLFISFQEFWKERCNNVEYLSINDVFDVLKTFALDNFNKSDWRFYWGRVAYYAFSNKDKIDIIDFNVELFLRTILMMQMRTKINEEGLVN